MADSLRLTRRAMAAWAQISAAITPMGRQVAAHHCGLHSDEAAALDRLRANLLDAGHPRTWFERNHQRMKADKAYRIVAGLEVDKGAFGDLLRACNAGIAIGEVQNCALPAWTEKALRALLEPQWEADRQGEDTRQAERDRQRAARERAEAEYRQQQLAASVKAAETKPQERPMEPSTATVLMPPSDPPKKVTVSERAMEKVRTELKRRKINLSDDLSWETKRQIADATGFATTTASQIITEIRREAGLLRQKGTPPEPVVEAAGEPSLAERASQALLDRGISEGELATLIDDYPEWAEWALRWCEWTSGPLFERFPNDLLLSMISMAASGDVRAQEPPDAAITRWDVENSEGLDEPAEEAPAAGEVLASGDPRLVAVETDELSAKDSEIRQLRAAMLSETEEHEQTRAEYHRAQNSLNAATATLAAAMEGLEYNAEVPMWTNAAAAIGELRAQATYLIERYEKALADREETWARVLELERAAAQQQVNGATPHGITMLISRREIVRGEADDTPRAMLTNEQRLKAVGLINELDGGLPERAEMLRLATDVAGVALR